MKIDTFGWVFAAAAQKTPKGPHSFASPAGLEGLKLDRLAAPTSTYPSTSKRRISAAVATRAAGAAAAPPAAPKSGANAALAPWGVVDSPPLLLVAMNWPIGCLENSAAAVTAAAAAAAADAPAGLRGSCGAAAAALDAPASLGGPSLEGAAQGPWVVMVVPEHSARQPLA